MLNSLKLKLGTPVAPNGKDAARLVMALSGVALLLGLGTLNGAALSTSAFDTFVTVLTGILQSSYVQAIALMVLVIGVWMAKTGKGWTVLEWLVALIIIAFIIPKIFTSTATSTRSLEEVDQADAEAAAVAVHAPLAPTLILHAAR
jgi:phosphotransferase system  glucose/maltose/N-acetylglucosamine-specific IIC component